MKQVVMFCDICGKVIDGADRASCYKIKKHNFFRNDWEGIDAHTSCVEMLLKAKEARLGNE